MPIPQQGTRSYLSEHDTFMQAGHQCRAGHWWHAQSKDKSPQEVDNIVARLLAHLASCPGTPMPARQYLAERIARVNRG